MPVHSAFLVYFQEVCRHGSIRAAARHLNIASSAVNRQILKVERELGVTLFARSRSGLVLTSAGEHLLAHVNRTLVDAQRTLAEIVPAEDSTERSVVIAGQESVISRFLPPALVELHARRPGLSTVFKAAGGTALEDMLRAGGADIVLAFDPRDQLAIRQTASCALPVGAVLTPAHPLAGRTAVSLADCAPYPVVLPDESWPLRHRLDAEMAATGLAFTVMTTSNSVEFLKAMVDQQLGIGFQTVVGIESLVESGELRHVPLANPHPVMQILAVCVRTDSTASPIIAEVVDLLARRIAAYGDPPAARQAPRR